MAYERNEIYSKRVMQGLANGRDWEGLGEKWEENKCDGNKWN